MRQLRTILSESTNPYVNIALEEYLLFHTEPEECILYLWQNQKTVVIGYNQNAWNECRIEDLEADGGYLARRRSGGGAVFHDLGNLNFTFLVRRAGYDVEKQTEVLLRAVQSFGIPAVRTGRNDLSVNGRKFSGNAFYRTGDFCYHHGTLLIHADMQNMSRYLNVSRRKLQSKGVESVKSRVINLNEYGQTITVDRMKDALIQSFSTVYGQSATPITTAQIPVEEWMEGQLRFASKEWIYGRKIPFNLEISRRFDWGEVLVRLDLDGGKIKEAGIWTDALDTGLPAKICEALTGLWFRAEDIRLGLSRIICEHALQKQMISDLVACLTEEESHGTTI